MSSIYNNSYTELVSNSNSYRDYLTEMLKVEDKLWWSRASKKNTQKAYEDYLLDYSNGIYSLEAKRRVDEFIVIAKETKHWNAICQKNTQKAYENYLLEYKNAIFLIEAKKKIDEFIDIERRKQLAIVKEKERWKFVCQENTQRAYESYLFNYPTGTHAFEAKKKIDEFITIIKEKSSWKTVCQQDTQKAYMRYLLDYPSGIYSSEAKRKVDELIVIKKEKERLAELARKKEEEARLAELAKKEEEARLVELARKKEEEARLVELARKKEEEARLAELARKKEEEARLAELAKKEEEARLVELARKKEEEARLVELARKKEEEEERLAELARKKRVKDELYNSIYGILGLLYLFFSFYSLGLVGGLGLVLGSVVAITLSLLMLSEDEKNIGFIIGFIIVIIIMNITLIYIFIGEDETISDETSIHHQQSKQELLKYPSSIVDHSYMDYLDIKKKEEILITDLVLSFYKKEEISNNPNEFIGFFSYPIIKYYGEENASEEFMLKNKEEYFKNWGQRIYTNFKLDLNEVTKINLDGTFSEIMEVRVVFDYQLNNDTKQIEGVSRHLLTIQKINTKFLITSIGRAENLH